ncbi:hypothetical protein [Kordia jejudonensis]|uniref:hypothetical protein n=1 Tax=Kordia jejudonensis TaxID=1348245 RepID=UPI0012E0763E|nr:hypothetical protein [Kordia jejudonensis]
MKKRNLKVLTLNKKAISNFNLHTITGAAPNTMTYCNCQEPDQGPITIETRCNTMWCI